MTTKIISLGLIGVLAATSLALGGCSVAHVTNRGEYIDQNTVTRGMPRKELLARFGQPIDSRMEGKTRVDIFRTPQGETAGTKAAKGAGLLVVGILTLGLSEAIASPVTEQKEYVTIEVKYDENDLAKEVVFISKP